MAIFVYLHIPDTPESAKYLSTRQRKVAKLRLRKENERPKKRVREGLNWKEIKETLLDPKSYFTAVSLSHSKRDSI